MTKPAGLIKQDLFLTRIHSTQLFCPACGKTHSLIELRGGNDWSKTEPNEYTCPNTGGLVGHYTALLGGESYLTRK